MNIKQLRERLGLTQQGLAVELGCAVATVHRWEAGISEPSGFARKALDALERGAKKERGAKSASRTSAGLPTSSSRSPPPGISTPAPRASATSMSRSRR